MNPNPLLLCPKCDHWFRVSPSIDFDPTGETFCIKCGFHTIGNVFVEAAREA